MWSLEQMEEAGATVVNSHEARTVLDGHFSYSGEIPACRHLRRVGRTTSAGRRGATGSPIRF